MTVTPSNITVDSVEATPGIGHILFRIVYTDPNAFKKFVPRHPGRLGGLAHRQLKYIEVWSHTANDRGSLDGDGNPTTATLVAFGRETAAHLGLVEGTTRFYWFRAVDNSGRQGEFSTAQTAGIQATAGFAASSVFSLINGTVVASVSSNALTIAVKTLSGDDPSAANPVLCAFRSSTLSSSSLTVRAVTGTLSFTISNGSTLSTANSIAFRVWVALFDDGGTVRLAAANFSNGFGVAAISENNVASATAEGGAGGADALGVFYATSAVSSKPFRYVAFMEWTSGLATAGAWSAGPTIITLVGPGTKRPGDLVQSNSNFVGGYTSFVSDIPFDNTVPLDSEGSSFFSVAITPTSPVNLIRNEFEAHVARSTAGPLIAALFKTGSSSAIAVATQNAAADSPVKVSASHIAAAGGTAQQTYTMNVGATAGATVYRNGNSGGQLFNGGLRAFHAVSEIMG